MHYWGDEWFQKNGDDLYNAIDFIEKYLRKHHIGVCGKEKFGQYRDDFLHFWNGGLYEILFGYRARIGTIHSYKFSTYNKDYSDNSFQIKWNKNVAPKIVKFVDKIHHFIYFVLDEGMIKKKPGEDIGTWADRYSERLWKGLCNISDKIGLLNLVQRHQAKMYNKAFQIACKKWPNVIDELICDISGYKMIKPCKWGNVDGEKIHNKYWKTLK